MEPQDLPRLSQASERVISYAAEESKRLEHHFVGVEHLFLGLARELTELLNEAFLQQQKELSRFVWTLQEKIHDVRHRAWGDQLIFTPRCSEILTLARRAVARQGAPEVEPQHLLEAVFREGRSVPIRLLRALEIDVIELESALCQTSQNAPQNSETPILTALGRDLTAMAAVGRLTPVVGRKRELDLVAQVLLRKGKNNPVLLGEAGVGKTAVVEGFAQLLASPECPEPLRGRRILEVSVSSLVAGTRFRGEFEERLLALMKEAQTHPEIILFLDEIHGLVGAGASSGESLDAANIFKPALARGDLRCIGATTIEEYRRTIERDAALDRRFAPILVEEPTPPEAQEILSRLKPSLEAFHQVHITGEALQTAVDLTVQHVIARRLPDKAIDALDQSCARRRLQRVAGAAPTKKEQRITGEDIRATIAQWTGIPLERLSAEKAKDALDLEEQLKARVVGQDNAVAAVARAVLTARAGLAAPNRPLGVFLFLGPTGVGKTQLARSLAQLLFGDDKKLVRFDMSEFTEAHSVAKLIGAPPGYIGHDKEGLLIAALRTHPHAVVLFDEIEKAHSQVFDLFLQIFDEGRLAGARGERADFTQSIVILTSNIQVQSKVKEALGFKNVPVDEALLDPRASLAGHFRPELINRLDEVVLFRKLEKSDLHRIIDNHVRELDKQLQGRKLRLKLDDKVYDQLIQAGFAEQYGARELRRVFDRQVRQPLAGALLRQSWPGGVVHVVLENGTVAFKAEEGKEA
jgi:ATP-dependent Clp protease ATP-binding subunit ClpC